MPPKWLGLVALASVLSCTTAWQPIDTNALVRSKPRSLLVVYFPNEAFMGDIQGPFGTGGILAAGIRGRDVYRDHRLVDPTRRIGETVGASFARHHELKFGVVVEKHPPARTRYDIVPPPPPPRPAADLFLEVETSEWGFVIPWLRPAIVYFRMRAKLIDARSGSVIAHGQCNNDSRTQLAANTSYKGLLEDDAAVVKRRLAFAEAGCISDLTTKLLLVPPTPPAPATSAPAPVDAGAPEAAPPRGPVPQQADPE